MALPLSYTNYNQNPTPVANGLGAETRRNQIVNPLVVPSASLTQIRVNDFNNPSFEWPTVGVGGWNDSNAVTLSTVTGTGVVNGSRALRQAPTGASNDSFIGSGAAGSRILPLLPDGANVTVLATVTVPAAQIGTLHAKARRIVMFTKNTAAGGVYTEALSSAAPNVAGTYTLTTNITIATGAGVEFFFRLYNGSNNAADVLYWDSVSVQLTSTIASSGNTYFDGSLPVADTDAGRLTRSWLGAAHNSRSAESAYTIPNYTNISTSVARWTGLRSFISPGSMATSWTGSAASMIAGTSTAVTLPAATQHTFSAYVYRPASAPTMKLRASGPGMTNTDSVVTALTGSWERLSVTFTTVTAGVYTMALMNFAAVTVASVPVQSDGWQLETGGTATSFFSGDTVAANLSYQWTNVANGSASTETGMAMPLYTANAATVTATTISSIMRVAINPNSASTASKAYIGTGGPGAMRTGLVAGKTYYISARLRIDAGALAGTPDALNFRNLTFYSRIGAGTVFEQRTVPSTNATGDYTHTMTFTVPVGATEAYISLNHGHPTGAAAVYWDKIMITDAEYVQTKAFLGDQPDLPQLTANLVTLTNTANANAQESTLTPTTTNVSYAKWAGTPIQTPAPLGIVKGKSYSITGNIRLTAPLTTTLNAASRTIQVLVTNPSGTTTYTSNQPTNTAATTACTVAFTTPADMTSVEVRLWNGAASTGGAVHWNRVTLTDTTLPSYAATYFDGTTSPVYAGRITRWLGTTNASNSQFLFRGLWIEGDTTISPPRVTFTAAGLGLGKVSSVTIRRVAGADTMPVPGWSGKNVVDIGVGIDWLVPLNTNVEYQLWVDGSQIDTETISFTSAAGWICDPLVPGDAMPIYTVANNNYLQLTKAAMAEKAYTSERDSVTPIGSRYPVARAGQRQLLQGLDMSVQAPANVTSDQFYEMAKDAPILCIRTHPSWGNMPPVIYLACDVTETPLTRQVGGQFTVWNIEGDVVAPVSRGPVSAYVTHQQVQTALTARTHQSIKDISSGRRWADIQADPLSLGV